LVFDKVSWSDIPMLAAAVLSFPTVEVARAIADGRRHTNSDCRSCLEGTQSQAYSFIVKL
ncbi:MAG TPA: hypothetical protein VK148_29270, partial [Xanthobacteraceae bacterium]|nr:hypothetical protein [Xanthobacteraceae bacterium]